MSPQPTTSWCVYIIQSDDDLLYTGITNNLERRWQAHLQQKGGAKFFRGRRPKQLLYVERGHDRASASQREAAIKRMPRAKKLQLVASAQPD
ncbi:MAG: GIY-YIG nuclease family protein [Exilibacterium sp.]